MCLHIFSNRLYFILVFFSISYAKSTYVLKRGYRVTNPSSSCWQTNYPARIVWNKSRCNWNKVSFKFELDIYCFVHPIFSSFGFWYFGHFSCVIFFPFFPSCPSCLAKCKQRLCNIFVTSLPKVTKNKKLDEWNKWFLVGRIVFNDYQSILSLGMEYTSPNVTCKAKNQKRGGNIVKGHHKKIRW